MINHSNAPLACLCFSKDRPMQLDGYLRSVRRYFSAPVSMTVIYTSTAEAVEQGYDALAEQHCDVRFLRQEDFGTQCLTWLAEQSADYLLFGCDDVVYIRPVVVQRIIRLFKSHHPMAFSLRLGKNIQYTHTTRAQIPQPPFTSIAPNLLIWQWNMAQGDWGYPFDLNGTIYPASLLRALLEGMDTLHKSNPSQEWRHPNLMESKGCQLLRAAQNTSPFACFETSCLVVPTVNQVQNVGLNRLMGAFISPCELEEKRRQGIIMDLKAYEQHSYNRIHIGDFFTTTAPIAKD